MPRTLSTTEQKHSSVEKEANVIIETLQKWKHLVAGKHFNLIIDQRSVSFVLGLRHSSKIKNYKIMRCRWELASLISLPSIDLQVATLRQVRFLEQHLRQ